MLNARHHSPLFLWLIRISRPLIAPPSSTTDLIIIIEDRFVLHNYDFCYKSRGQLKPLWVARTKFVRSFRFKFYVGYIPNVLLFIHEQPT